MYILTRRWVYGLIVAGALLSVFYAVYAARSIPRGGSPTGYLLGITGAGLILFHILLPVRKRQYQRPMGRLDIWMRAHVFTGLLSALIVGMHAGFTVVGTLSVALTVVFGLTLLSGIIGIILYEKLPLRIVLMGNNTFRQQALRDQMSDMEREMEALREGQSEAFCAAVRRTFEAQRTPDTLNPVRWIQWRRRQQAPPGEGSGLSGPEQAMFQAAQAMILRHRQLGCQLGHQRLLRQWLWTHIPLSAALVTFLLVHIISALYY